MTNTNTKLSKAWRETQRKAGFVPKLVWVHPDDWGPVLALLKSLKRRRAEKEQK
jgi:hypothetical protein